MSSLIWIAEVDKQTRKSSEDTQIAGYARFEKVWAKEALGQKSLSPKKVLAELDNLKKNSFCSIFLFD